MRRVKFLLFLLPAIILLFPLPRSVYSAYSDSEVFEAAKDTYANQAYPDKINGGYNHIIISNKFTTRLAYLQFENIDLPEGAILDSAKLKFYVYEQHYSDTAKLNVGPISGDWEENSLTWNNKPAINQAQAIEAEISIADSGWKEVAVTSLVRKWLDGDLENKGVFIYPYGFLYASPETEYAFTFKSREEGGDKPKLEVAYHFEEPTPTPSPSPSPSPSPTPGETPSPTPAEEPSPTPEESPSPSPEAEEEKAGILGLSTGQTVIGGLILLSLIGAGIAFAAYSRRKPKKPKKPKKKEEKPKPEPEPEEKKEEG